MNAAKFKPELVDDPHLDAVLTGLANQSYGKERAVEILESCGYTKDEALAALSKVGVA